MNCDGETGGDEHVGDERSSNSCACVAKGSTDMEGDTKSSDSSILLLLLLFLFMRLIFALPIKSLDCFIDTDEETDDVDEDADGHLLLLINALLVN